jgi:hypothetical protein
MTTTGLGSTIVLVQRLEAQIAALRALSDEAFAEVDGFGLAPIHVSVRTAQAPGSSVQQ